MVFSNEFIRNVCFALALFFNSAIAYADGVSTPSKDSSNHAAQPSTVAPSNPFAQDWSSVPALSPHMRVLDKMLYAHTRLVEAKPYLWQAETALQSENWSLVSEVALKGIDTIGHAYHETGVRSYGIERIDKIRNAPANSPDAARKRLDVLQLHIQLLEQKVKRNTGKLITHSNQPLPTDESKQLKTDIANGITRAQHLMSQEHYVLANAYVDTLMLASQALRHGAPNNDITTTTTHPSETGELILELESKLHRLSEAMQTTQP